MDGRRAWSGWPDEGYQRQNDEHYYRQPTPSYGQSYEQGSFFNHSSIRETRDEMLNPPWGYRPQQNFHHSYAPTTHYHHPPPDIYQVEQQPQEPAQSQVDEMSQWMHDMKKMLEANMKTMEEMNSTMRKFSNNGQIEFEEPLVQEPVLQPCHDDDEGLRIYDEEEVEETLCDEGSRVLVWKDNLIRVYFYLNLLRFV